jgi:predicted xylose isomerase-like sugar epimerase
LAGCVLSDIERIRNIGASCGRGPVLIEPRDWIGASKTGRIGLQGFVERLGFPIASRRFKRAPLAAIDDIQVADGFDGIVSFEPFAKEVHDLALPVAAARASMAHVREALAMS